MIKDDFFYILKRLVKNHIRPYFKELLLASILMVVVALCAAALVQIVKPAFDNIFYSSDRSMLFILPLSIIAVQCIKALAEFAQEYLVRSTGQKILIDLQVLLFEHLMHSDLSFIRSQPPGKFISRFTNDIQLMKSAVSSLLVGIAKNLLMVVFLVIMMFKMDPTLSIIVFFVFPVAIYPVQQIGRRMRNTVYAMQEKLSDYTATLDEVFLSIEVVKSYMGENLEISKAKEHMKEIYKISRRSILLDCLTSPMTEALSGVALAVILFYGGWQIINQTSTPGAVISFITAFVAAYRPFKDILSLNVRLQEGIAASKRLFEILDTKPTIIDIPSAIDVKLGNPNIYFENVNLEITDKHILNDVTFEIPAGKITAIVGQSGSGKTSIINLLLKFYEPTSGKILLGNHSIRDIKTDSLRAQIALVSQSVLLFDTSVLENIRYTMDADEEAVIKASKDALADEFVKQMSQGYESQIGFQGTKLSGGQRQRLSLARAFVKKAPILILDEATSSLDSQNEEAILDSIKNKKQTIIIVTHKLSSIKDADNIIVLKDGMVVGQGKHDELLKDNIHYAEMYNKVE
ncbi:multidrug resistance protein [Candidatus Phycorickettsia trachydisci]|uniref:Multidrug resistance protein n=1 Tax=Candidatus Phycorickettsia trachydisci TaxID=2115978 RepID=A0A2P1PA01_9RICK|nr:ABC transporter ATP-binding protein [Candidatus Phycorickettsia trachydisci]AVP88090.1 multidrug resistance protein [Candidatus Phycorickettsia trachydisci]